VDAHGVVVAHSDTKLVGDTMPGRGDLAALLKLGLVGQLRAIYSTEGQLEVSKPLLLDSSAFGAIRIGVSTLLIRRDINSVLGPALIAVGVALVGSSVVATLLAQLLLRPIHVLRRSLTRLGERDFDVSDALPRDEFGELGESLAVASARLLADRAGPVAGHDDTEPATNRLALMVAKDLERWRQVPSSLNYARRLAALGRLSAGLAHEIKNPLNATMIRLELLRQQLLPDGDSAATGGGDGASAGAHDASATSDLEEHVNVIAAQIRRLDEVVQGFLKFIRPEDVRLQVVALADILAAIMPIIEAEAQAHGVDVRTELPAGLPDLAADQAMLEQAFLNLAINACQAMPQGGTLRVAAAATWGRYVEVRFEDTGVGIPPGQLDKIFDLYFTTKEGGSGIGLSMVFRTVHLHGGEITVESTPGRGTTFRLLLPQA
jgi:signal transduction histidine kinase